MSTQPIRSSSPSKEANNCKDWKLSILSVLFLKDALEFVPTTRALADDKDKRNTGKCFAHIIQSLSLVITSSLLAKCCNLLNPKAAVLWNHRKKDLFGSSQRQASDSGA
jgi:hypothetical protein